jgi:hypothetical protein
MKAFLVATVVIVLLFAGGLGFVWWVTQPGEPGRGTGAGPGSGRPSEPPAARPEEARAAWPATDPQAPAGAGFQPLVVSPGALPIDPRSDLPQPTDARADALMEYRGAVMETQMEQLNRRNAQRAAARAAGVDQLVPPPDTPAARRRRGVVEPVKSDP